jgi:dipeptidyl aminopeptidase/acylaminoacyl peptidase
MGSGQMVVRYTALHSALRDGSDDVLVLNNERNARFPDVYRMNTRTARKTILTAENPGNIVAWVADRQGAVRAAVSDEESKTSRVYWRAAAESAWVQLGEYRQRGESMMPVAFDGDGSLLVASNLGRDKAALYRYDTAAKKLGAELVAHPQVDLTGGFRFDRTKNQIVGIAYSGDRPGVAWFDEEYARLQDAVDKALPDRMNAISWGTGSSRVLIASYSDTDPGSYYLLDREKRKLEFLAAQRKAIKPETMPNRKPVRYAARDGLEIPAYLTLPKGRESAKGLPLVLYVHGGPWVRGADWRWSAEPAYLASLGYAVLQPEFRSSTGWGRRLHESGYRQWGRAMQDDLDDSDYIKHAAKEMIGDPDTDAAQLKATSPLEQAARIKAPVLMAYGGLDYRVPLVHGEKMRDALLANGTPVEWIVYTEEGHGFMLESTRMDFYQRVARFLDRHIGAK